MYGVHWSTPNCGWIYTKYGKTTKIRIRDSIRQGGVLSVLQYALLMDEIGKEIDKKDLGVDL